jgi:hypothetical protein
MNGPRSIIVLYLKRNFLWKKAQSPFLGILRTANLSREKPKMAQDTSPDLCVLRN